MHSVKVIQFKYTASNEIHSLFEDFRRMCNDAVRIAVETSPKSKFALIAAAYPRLKEYALHTHYILSACEVAFAAWRNKARYSIPYVRRSFLKLDVQSYSLNHLILRIPSRPREFIYLTLQGSNYHLSFLNDPTLKRGSIVLTRDFLGIAFTKYAAENRPRGSVGVDINERNVTTSDTLGTTIMYDMSDISEMKERYRKIRARISRMTFKDARVERKLLAKYGGRERRRTRLALNQVTKRIASQAKANGLGIAMERLKGIRRLYRKGNGNSATHRGRMNSWPFREIQRQIEYKARWDGIQVTYVNPRGTSRNCPECGSPLVRLEGRTLLCPSCRMTGDRDVIASRNILACAVPQVLPSVCSFEGERSEDGSNPLSRRMEVE